MKNFIMLITCTFFLGACTNTVPVVKEETVSVVKEETSYIEISCEQHNEDLKTLILLRLHGKGDTIQFKERINSSNIRPDVKKLYLAMVDSVYDSKLATTEEEMIEQAEKLYVSNSLVCPQ